VDSADDLIERGIATGLVLAWTASTWLLSAMLFT
jgi:hypothetical protein